MGRAQIWDGSQWIDMTGGTPPGGGEVSTDHALLTNVQTGQHHARYSDAEAVSANTGLWVPSGGRGTLLDLAYLSGSVAPASENVLLSHTVNLESAGQPVIVDVVGSLRCSAMDEGEGFEAYIRIDASDYMRARVEFPAAQSHSHSKPEVDVFGNSGTTSSHNHASGTYKAVSGTTGSSTQQSADGEMTATPIALREHTAAGSSFNVTLIGNIRTGAPSSWFNNMKILVFRA